VPRMPSSRLLLTCRFADRIPDRPWERAQVLPVGAGLIGNPGREADASPASCRAEDQGKSPWKAQIICKIRINRVVRRLSFGRGRRRPMVRPRCEKVRMNVLTCASGRCSRHLPARVRRRRGWAPPGRTPRPGRAPLGSQVPESAWKSPIYFAEDGTDSPSCPAAIPGPGPASSPCR
jgi:hypothetical protein